MNGYRTCKKCNREKTTNRFYGGNVCIECEQKAYVAPTKAKNVRQVVKRAKAFKAEARGRTTCPKCNRTLPPSAFYTTSRIKKCKECHREYMRLQALRKRA